MPEIQMPKLSDTMTEGTLVSWKKKKGDKVSAGEVIAEIETDKATMEWESPEDGTLTEIYVEEGGKVNVGDKIAFIAGEGEEAPKKEETPKKEEKKEPARKEEKAEEKKEKKSQAETEKPAPAEQKEKDTAPPQEKKKPDKAEKKTVEAGVSPAQEQPGRLPPQPEEARVKASPVARRVAAELGVDLSSVKGTGPEGRVTETDVRAATKSKGAASAQKAPAAAKPSTPSIKAGEGARIQLSGMRKIIAQRLVESLGPVPHFYLSIEINAAPLMAAREELKSAGEGGDTAKITVNDFVLKGGGEGGGK